MTLAVRIMAQQARAAAHALAATTGPERDKALSCISQRITDSAERILEANQLDLANARANGMESGLLDRLTVDRGRIESMCEGLRQVASLEDPIGTMSTLEKQSSGIRLGKMRVPIGVIGIIYESRPNVTADAAGLCLKSGNAVILRGGSEALHSNCAIGDCITEGLTLANLSVDCVQLIRTADRDAVTEMLQCEQDIDVIIPRGGKSLIEKVAAESKVPIIKHLDGICHVFVDRDAKVDQALAIAVNAKTHRYGVCNAMETLLIDSVIAADFLPKVAKAMESKGVEVRVSEQARQWWPSAKQATEEDWSTEYLAAILSIKVVADIKEAIEHINHYGSHHTDAIVTENKATAKQFINRVDSSSVMVNASTRFADGFEYGLGAEIGISTDKLHARGPVGLEGLTTYKYVVFGEGQIRE